MKPKKTETETKYNTKTTKIEINEKLNIKGRHKEDKRKGKNTKKGHTRKTRRAREQEDDYKKERNISGR